MARIHWTDNSLLRAILMTSTTGASPATASTKACGRRATSHPMSSVTKIWTLTAHGAPTRLMATSGNRRQFNPDGPRIAMAIGFGFPPGDGLGLTTLLGATHHSIMAVGFLCAADGDGCPDRSMSNPSTRRL